MKRLRRIIFNALTALSLLLCLATVVLWAYSYRHIPFLNRQLQSRDTRTFWVVELCVSSGQLQFGIDRARWNQTLDPYPVHWTYGRDGNRDNNSLYENRLPGPRWSIGHLVEYSSTYSASANWTRMDKSDNRDDVFYAPIALLFILSASLPAWRLNSRLRRNRRTGKGLCPICNYDLRATPDRCPECGMVPVARAKSGLQQSNPAHNAC